MTVEEFVALKERGDPYELVAAAVRDLMAQKFPGAAYAALTVSLGPDVPAFVLPVTAARRPASPSSPRPGRA